MYAAMLWPPVRVILVALVAMAIMFVAAASTAQTTAPKTQAPASAQQAKGPQQTTQTTRQILAFKPTTGELIPVTAAELRPGNIYSHYSERLGRQVWSICGPDKKFWNAFGAGTCQGVHLFEWEERMDAKQQEAALDRLKKLNPGVYEQYVQEGSPVFLELGRDGRWTVTRTSIAAINDAETGGRWEWQFGRYIPARRTSDYGW
jgi:hypothetical protein